MIAAVIRDPGRMAFKNAVRLGLVAPAAFAFAFVVLDDPAAATFAVFGSLGLLLFADFGGPRRVRAVSFLGLAAAGALLVALGTLAGTRPWLAVAGMAVAGFVVLFSGVLNGAFAAASTCALLAFVLAVTVPAPVGELPSRLAGWAIACAAAIPAALLLWPRRPRDLLYARAAAATHALAAAVRAPRDAARARRAQAAAAATREQFLRTPYRPSGATGPGAALAHLIDDVDWLTQLARARAAAPSDDALEAERTELEAAVVQVLEAAAARLDGVSRGARPGSGAASAQPDLARLTAAREELARGFLALAGESGPGREAVLERQLEEAFHLRALSFGAWQLAANALRASRAPAPPTDETLPAADVAQGPRETLGAARELTRAYASMRSVWLQNSIRGALGLALAVAVGELADLQHAFWAVLGTISVLRSHALSAGTTLLRVVGGTFAGVVVGGLLILAIGDDQTALWILLAPTVMLAGYAPRAINLFVGQAAFSVCVLVLFNLIEPVGWSIGLVRVEDVAIGAGISLLVGLLLWPRGATAVMRGSVATAYARSADYLTATIAALLDGRSPAELAEPAAAALDAGRRLDDAFRQYLAEPAGGHADFHRISVLLSGTTRVRRAAHSLRAAAVMLPLRPLEAGDPLRAELERELADLGDWYRRLGDAIAGTADAPPAPRAVSLAADAAAGEPLLTRVGDAGGDRRRATLAIAWTRQHLLMLARLEQPLAQAAEALGSGRSG